MAEDVRESSLNGQSRRSNKRSWASLNPPLAEWILDAIRSMRFSQTTPVQASTIPLFMSHKDVVVEAVTGSGKTLAFLIPVVERILRLEDRTKKHHVAAIIISPTRELASQIYEVLKTLLAFHSPSSALINSQEGRGIETATELEVAALNSDKSAVLPQLVVGGQKSPAEDLSYFLKYSPNLLVATPGRLLEMLSSSHVHCPQSSFEVLVLDEADRLLDMGFKDDLQRILSKLPKQRRTGLFSASVSEAVDQIVRVGLRNPVKISVKVKGSKGSEDQRTPSSLQMSYLVTKASQKLPALFKILSHPDICPNKTIIYLSTCAAVDYFQHVLAPLLSSERDLPFDLFPLHGKHLPKVRQKNFKSFSDSTNPSILLTTDVAARGLDIPTVDLVIQVDPPSDPKVFLHRCGRAGRASRKGLSILFLQPGREEEYIRFLDIRKTPITPFLDPPIHINEEETSAFVEKCRSIVLKDRAIHDKGQRGFVSWVKAYSKHQASSIFRLGDIDWEDQGRAWALLKLPKMPELSKWTGDRSLGVDIDWTSFGYRDKKREEARLQPQPPAIVSEADSKSLHKKRRHNGAWSNNLERKEEREVRRSKKKAKREHDRLETMTPIEKQGHQELSEMIEQVRRKNGRLQELDDFEGFAS